jgi:hypothetical protein
MLTNRSRTPEEVQKMHRDRAAQLRRADRAYHDVLAQLRADRVPYPQAVKGALAAYDDIAQEPWL